MKETSQEKIIGLSLRDSIRAVAAIDIHEQVGTAQSVFAALAKGFRAPEDVQAKYTEGLRMLDDLMKSASSLTAGPPVSWRLPHRDETARCGQMARDKLMRTVFDPRSENDEDEAAECSDSPPILGFAAPSNGRSR